MRHLLRRCWRPSTSWRSETTRRSARGGERCARCGVMRSKVHWRWRSRSRCSSLPTRRSAPTGSPWFWPSFAMTGAAAVLAVLALTAAMPLAAARPEMRGRALWLTALAVVAHRPTRFVAVGSAVAAGVWAAAAWTASLLLLVPAPAAIVAVTATWTSLIDHVKEPERDDPAARGAGRRTRRVPRRRPTRRLNSTATT